MILVHASPKTLAPYRTENLGVLCSPRCVYADDIQEWPWAADNDAFSKWDAGRYADMLDRIDGREGCIFVTAPDIVGDAWGTMQRFNEWFPRLEGRFPVAFVGQDEQEHYPVQWDAIDAFFVGGTTEWKLGPGARRLILEAKERGKWVHMGRVNSYQRVRYARSLGCDSVDGTQFSWFRDAKLPAHLNALRQEMMVTEQHAPPQFVWIPNTVIGEGVGSRLVSSASNTHGCPRCGATGPLCPTYPCLEPLPKDKP